MTVTETPEQTCIENSSVLLAIETSQRAGSVALRTNDGVVHNEPLRTNSRHDDDLLPAIDRLFARCSLSPGDLQAVGVSIGPGGFTGLRIAVTTAKMFAETLGAILIAVPSALVAAEAHKSSGPIGVALASKREQFWWTVLNRTESDPNCWKIVGKPDQADAASADLTNLKAVLADQYLPRTMTAACENAGLTIHEPVFDAVSCLTAADRMLRAGATVDQIALTPLYSRQPEAVTLWDRKVGKTSG